jgi:hypothetical protein
VDTKSIQDHRTEGLSVALGRPLGFLLMFGLKWPESAIGAPSDRGKTLALDSQSVTQYANQR